MSDIGLFRGHILLVAHFLPVDLCWLLSQTKWNTLKDFSPIVVATVVLQYSAVKQEKCDRKTNLYLTQKTHQSCFKNILERFLENGKVFRNLFDTNLQNMKMPKVFAFSIFEQHFKFFIKYEFLEPRMGEIGIFLLTCTVPFTNLYPLQTSTNH